VELQPLVDALKGDILDKYPPSVECASNRCRLLLRPM